MPGAKERKPGKNAPRAKIVEHVVAAYREGR